MTSSKTSLLIIFLLCCRVFSATVGIPEPKVMLEKSDVVGVASLRKESYQWQIKFSRLLKGKVRTGVWIPLAKPLSLDLDMFGKMVGKESFLFLGFDRQENGHLMPSYWLVSAWPQGKPRDSRLETLEGCVTFAEAVLEKKPLVGENTMSIDEVLPPMFTEIQLKELRQEDEAEAARAFGLNQDTGSRELTAEGGGFTGSKDAQSSATQLPQEAVIYSKVSNYREKAGVALAIIACLVVAGFSFYALKRKRE